MASSTLGEKLTRCFVNTLGDWAPHQKTSNMTGSVLSKLDRLKTIGITTLYEKRLFRLLKA
jgi:hypothetical protein